MQAHPATGQLSLYVRFRHLGLRWTTSRHQPRTVSRPRLHDGGCLARRGFGLGLHQSDIKLARIFDTIARSPHGLCTSVHISLANLLLQNLLRAPGGLLPNIQ